jgi:hypothetical protein
VSSISLIPAESSDRLYDRIKVTDASRLQEEYAKLVEGLQEADAARQEDAFLTSPGKCFFMHQH